MRVAQKLSYNVFLTARMQQTALKLAGQKIKSESHITLLNEIAPYAVKIHTTQSAGDEKTTSKGKLGTTGAT